MKKALISPNEKVLYISGWDGQSPVYTELGQRVAEVCDAEFEVAAPLFWLDCADDVVADQFYYDGTAIQAVPESPLQPEVIQPTTTGTQTL